ncbi:MAG: hypothetical protein ACYTFZ_01070 [Planctomycetota bacterium]|jgi:DNA repair exonuclease SbcCD ATPase subunit
MNILEHLTSIHRGGDWVPLVAFYGVVAGTIVLVCLLIMLVRGRSLALRALETARQLVEDMRAWSVQLDELERRVERRLDARTGDLDARMTRKLEQRGDLIQARVEENRATLADSVSKLDARLGRALEDVGNFRERIAEVDGRIPGLFDRLEEFRDTLAKTFQIELGSVLGSFDSTLGGILQEMKTELQVGISRIENIESMVRSRERAERTLLGSPDAPELPEAGQEEGDFEEWELEAKELAEGGEADQEGETAELVGAPADASGEIDTEYPAEMGESGGGPGADELEAALYEEDAEEPDAEAEEADPEDR